ncbi:MAG: hypothetical protein L6Q97_22675 [Thermoanaerobaculia bacterium]|nr:hypothetical protein [Thermoanaerobaculia bacterium]
MQKLKFLALLKNLSRQEMDGFHRYLGQYHRREKIALRVFEYLIRFYPDFEQKEQLRLAYAYQKIFKTDFDKDKHAQKKMLNTASDLYKWLKHFLIVSKAQQNHQLQQTIWLSILQERGMKKEFSGKATAFYHQTRNAPFKTTADAFPNWMASYFHREHLSWDRPLIHAKIIQQCTETMTGCWEIIRLKMACEMSLVKRFANQALPRQLREPTDFQQVGLSILREVYESLWQLTDSGEEAHFVRLESLLKQYGEHIDPKELEGIIRYAYNFTADKSRHNQEAIHYERTHRLNKIGLAFGVFSQDGHMTSPAFGNMVTVACHAKDFEWASGFIRDYSHIILENKRQEAVLLAQAILAFETGKFQEVLHRLKAAKFEDQLDNLRSKSLLLRSYYELHADQDTILDICAYIENSLRRSSPKTEANKAMLAFILILKRLAVQKSSKKAIIDRIEKAPLLYCKNWLLEKTMRYKARYAARGRAAKRHTPATK